MQPIPIQRVRRPVASPTPLAVVDAPHRRRVGPWLSVLIVILGGAAIGGAQAYRWRAATRPALRTELVTRGAVVGFLKLEGRLQTRETVRVGSLSSGQVTAVSVAAGDRVRRGQVLAQLDDLEQRSAAADARSAAEAAEIQRARAEKRLVEELGKLDDPGSSAGDLGPDDLLLGSAGNAQLDLMSAYVQVDRASAKRALAKGVLARRMIRSPIDGIVLDRAVDAGETISYSPPGPPLFVIGSDPEQLLLDVEIDRTYASHVRPTQVTLTVPDHPRRSFAARVRQVLPASPFPVSSGGYRILLDVDNKDGALRPGMTAAFALPMETPTSSLRLPVAALMPPPPRSGPRDAVVFVVDGHGVRAPVPVEIGVTNDRIAEVHAGSLRPGAAVVVAGTP